MYTDSDIIQSEPVLDSTYLPLCAGRVSPAVAQVLSSAVFYAVIGFTWFCTRHFFLPFTFYLRFYLVLYWFDPRSLDTHELQITWGRILTGSRRGYPAYREQSVALVQKQPEDPELK